MVVRLPEVPAALLSGIYEAAADRERWPDIVEKLTAWAGGSVGALQARRFGDQPETLLISTGIDESFHRAYVEHHHLHDPHLAHIASLCVGRSLLSCEVIADSELRRTAYYNEFYRPQQLSDLQGVVLLRNEHWAVTLAMFAPDGHAFDEHTRARLDALAPHVLRALTLGFHFDGRRAVDPALLAAAQVRMVGCLSVDGQLRIVASEHSSAGEQWLRSEPCALQIRGNVLGARDVRDQPRLIEAVARAHAGSALLLSLGMGQGALTLALAPGLASAPFGKQRSVSIVFVRADGGRRLLFAELPAALRQVAELLGFGLSDEAIASELSLPLESVRAAVARIAVLAEARSSRTQSDD